MNGKLSSTEQATHSAWRQALVRGATTGAHEDRALSAHYRKKPATDSLWTTPLHAPWTSTLTGPRRPRPACRPSVF